MPECQTTARVIHSEDAGVEVIDEQSPRHRGSHTMQSSKRTKQATSNRRAERATAIANVRKTTKAPSGRAKKQASAAAAYASQQVGSAATVVASKDSCRVVHREFIGNVTGSTAFAISNSFAVNPGLPASFPWLSGMAANCWKCDPRS